MVNADGSPLTLDTVNAPHGALDSDLLIYRQEEGDYQVLEYYRENATDVVYLPWNAVDSVFALHSKTVRKVGCSSGSQRRFILRRDSFF